MSATRYINAFRAKSVTDDRWMYGDLIRGTHISHPRGATTIKPETVGMYTGLIDKKGTRVFEGDILGGYLDDEYPNSQTVVVVIWKNFGWHTQQYSNHGCILPDPLDLSDGEQFEVIGNIHDNPELITGKQVTI